MIRSRLCLVYVDNLKLNYNDPKYIIPPVDNIITG